jgi:hypothetical protein
LGSHLLSHLINFLDDIDPKVVPVALDGGDDGDIQCVQAVKHGNLKAGAWEGREGVKKGGLRRETRMQVRELGCWHPERGRTSNKTCGPWLEIERGREDLALCATHLIFRLLQLWKARDRKAKELLAGGAVVPLALADLPG